jgi:predicted O-methyltransferase YrrM
MSRCYEALDWLQYTMDYYHPHRELEPIEQETAVVAAGLRVLQECDILPRTEYDHDKMLAHRQRVRDAFEIPWTAISPRMQRLLYAINAIAQPRTLIAAGIFCGNTFISCAGAAVGSGACYRAERLVGVEIDPERAEMARRNLAVIDPDGVTEIRCEDAVKTAREFVGGIDLLYLDADGGTEHGKGIYLDILEAAYDRLRPGGIVLAHNSVNCAERLQRYLAFVRDPKHMRESVNMILDPEGLEVSVK